MLTLLMLIGIVVSIGVVIGGIVLALCLNKANKKPADTTCEKKKDYFDN